MTSTKHNVLIALCILAIIGYAIWQKVDRVKPVAVKPQTTVIRIGRSFECEASYYSFPEHGRKTASGAIFDSMGMTCATAHDLHIPWHKELLIEYNGNRVVVKNTDAMPDSIIHEHPDRWIDLAAAPFAMLADKRKGVIKIRVSEIIGYGGY